MLVVTSLFAACTGRNKLASTSSVGEDPLEFTEAIKGVEIPIDVSSFEKRFNDMEEKKLHMTVEHFQGLVEWALVLRQETLRFADKLKNRKQANAPITGEDLERLNKGIKQHLALRDRVLRLIRTYETVALADDTGSLISEPVRIKAAMLGLAAALILYDNFAISTVTFQNDEFLRRLSNRGDEGLEVQPNCLKRVLLSYHSPSKRARLRAVMNWLTTKSEWIDVNAASDSDLAYLKSVIESSPSSKNIRDDSKIGDYACYLGLFATRGTDRFARITEESMNVVSMGFGNTVGLVQIRKGRLHGDAEVTSQLKSILKPMDVLLEKTPFRLTDKFIPGHFGHVAIWVGTEAELKAVKLWDHPVIKPHQEAIRNGKCVIEALREGVVCNTLEHFMNVDDLAILRKRNPTADTTRESILRAFRQIGKAYDFNFDVETSDRIVCSELAYAVYTDVEWPTKKAVGRATISPDNVAVMALSEKPFFLVSFHRDGKELGKDRNTTFRVLIMPDE